MKKKLLIIVNPFSGNGRGKLVEKEIKKHLDASLYDYDVVYTKTHGDATELAKKAVNTGVDMIVVAGGDGTVNETGASLIGQNIPLAVIPIGSGNGLARHLKIPMCVKKSIKLINNHTTRLIDTGTLNDRIFLVTSGAGFDAHVADIFSRYGKRGFWSYVAISAREYFRYGKKSITITTSEKEISEKALLVTVANSSQYGNNIVIAPNASINDGLLDVCILKKPPLISLPFLLLRLFSGRIHGSYYYHSIRSDKIKIQQRDNIAHVDGEPIESGKILTILVNPLSLKIVVPKYIF